MSITIPPPGSPDATNQGCSCVGATGREIMTAVCADGAMYWVNVDCPLHGTTIHLDSGEAAAIRLGADGLHQRRAHAPATCRFGDAQTIQHELAFFDLFAQPTQHGRPPAAAKAAIDRPQVGQGPARKAGAIGPKPGKSQQRTLRVQRNQAILGLHHPHQIAPRARARPQDQAKFRPEGLPVQFDRLCPQPGGQAALHP